MSKTRKSVGNAAAVVMAAILLSRILAMVRDVMIAGLFGQGRNTDIYYAAFRLPDLLFYLIAGGALSSAFVPVFVEYLSTDRKDEAWKIFNIIGTTMAVVIGIVIVLGEIFARQIVPYVAAPGFHAHELDQLAHLTRILLPAQLFFFMGGLMMGVQWAHQKFVLPGLGPSIYNVGIIVGGAIAGTQFGPKGIEGLAWGALCGAFAGNFILQIFAVKRLGVKFRAIIDFHHPGAVKVWKLMIPVIFSLSLPQMDVYVNGWFATMLFAGAVTAVDRANRLMQIPIGLFGQAIAIAFFPTMSELAANHDTDGFRTTINYGLRVMAFVSIPATAILAVLRYPIIRLLFQHGKFTPANTHDVALALIFYSFGIWAWCSQALVARGFYSLQDTKTPVWTGTAVTFIFIPLNWLLINAFGGFSSHTAHQGLALSTSIAATLHMFLLMEIMRRRIGGLNSALLIKSVSKVAVASVALGAAAWFAMHWASALPQIAQHGVKVQSAAVLMISLLAGGAAFAVFVKILNIEEASDAIAMVKRRFSRG